MLWRLLFLICSLQTKASFFFFPPLLRVHVSFSRVTTSPTLFSLKSVSPVLATLPGLPCCRPVLVLSPFLSVIQSLIRPPAFAYALPLPESPSWFLWSGFKGPQGQSFEKPGPFKQMIPYSETFTREDENHQIGLSPLG